MADANETIVKIIDRQTYLGQEVLNIYHFVAPSVITSPNIGALLTSFESIYVTGIKAVQNNNLNHATLEGIQMNHGLGVSTLVVNELGSVTTGSRSPSLLAASFKLVRNVRGINNGRKVMSGLVDDDFEGNAFTGTGLTKWQAIETIFDTFISDGTNSWAPCILGKQNDVDPNTFNIGIVIDADLAPEVRPQNTRDVK